jgi:hypothetical protein
MKARLATNENQKTKLCHGNISKHKHCEEHPCMLMAEQDKQSKQLATFAAKESIPSGVLTATRKTVPQCCVQPWTTKNMRPTQANWGCVLPAKMEHHEMIFWN